MLELIVDKVNDIIWSNLFILLALFTGLYFSIRTGFLQIRFFRRMLHLLFNGKASDKGVSSFQAFAIAISGRVGTGNIAGVATAIAMGGPGAIFWMWVIAFVGAATAAVEASLGQYYKVIREGQYRGGPAFYIERGLKSRKYALAFAFVTLISCTFLLPGVQSNSIAVSVEHAFAVSPITIISIVVALMAVIIFGGVKRIGKVAEVIVPFMAIGYIGMAIVIIFINYKEIPSVFQLIISSAFNANATFSGVFGMAIAWGVKRGIYSNEAGQGTAPHAAAAAEVNHPLEQGLVQAFSVYIDTILVCTATAFMILFTNAYNVMGPDGAFIVEYIPGIEEGPAFTQEAINSYFPNNIGGKFVAIALVFFTFTTLMAYYFYAETNLSFLSKRNIPNFLLQAFRIVFLIIVFLGALHEANFAWKLGDIGVGLMAWLNIVALLLLRKKFMEIYKDYRRKFKKIKNT